MQRFAVLLVVPKNLYVDVYIAFYASKYTYRLLLSDIYTWLGKQMGLKCNIKLI